MSGLLALTALTPLRLGRDFISMMNQNSGVSRSEAGRRGGPLPMELSGQWWLPQAPGEDMAEF